MRYEELIAAARTGDGRAAKEAIASFARSIPDPGVRSSLELQIKDQADWRGGQSIGDYVEKTFIPRFAERSYYYPGGVAEELKTSSGGFLGKIGSIVSNTIGAPVKLVGGIASGKNVATTFRDTLADATLGVGRDVAGLAKSLPVVGGVADTLTGGSLTQLERSNATFADFVAGRGGRTFSDFRNAIYDQGQVAGKAAAAYLTAGAIGGASTLGQGAAALGGVKASTSLFKGDVAGALSGVPGLKGLVPSEVTDLYDTGKGFYDQIAPYLPKGSAPSAALPSSGGPAQVSGITPSSGEAEASQGQAMTYVIIGATILAAYLMTRKGK